jgi:acetylornithine deacetylase
MRAMSSAEVVAQLSRLIGVDTHNPGGDEPRLCNLLGEELRARGAEVRVVEVPRDGGVGAYVAATWGKPRLLINAHVDTVPPNAGWSRDPYRAHVDGGRVYGLGACDTKGAIAALLCALDAAPARDLCVLFSGDEEHTGTVVRAFLERERALVADVARAIVCEPTSCRAGTRHRGILAIEAAIEGHGGHSSRADELPAPLADGARLAVAFFEWGRAQRGRGPAGFTGMCMNVARLDGGIAFNVVPEEARVCISVRPPPGSDVDAVRAELFALATDVVPRARLSAPVANPSFSARAPHEFPAALGAGAPVDLAYWTEAALWVEAGIDCVVYGPGDIAQAHAADEFVPIADLEKARDTFASILAAHGG